MKDRESLYKRQKISNFEREIAQINVVSGAKGQQFYLF